MRKGKHRGLWVVALGLAAAYPFLFPHLQGRGIYLKPAWALDLAAAELDGPRQAAEPPYTWFRAGDRFGYVTLGGDLVYLDRVLFGVALSDSGFVNYPKVNDNLFFADTTGRYQYTLGGAGYPLLDPDGGRLFSVGSDLSGLRELGSDGQPLWSSEFSSPMTTMAVSGDRALVGLLEGKALLLDSEGARLFEVDSGGSRIPVIFGSALSPRGAHLAVISGIGPQRLLVFEAREGRYAAVFAGDLGEGVRREALLRFTGDGRYLLFERPDAVGVLDLGQKREYRIPLEGRLKEGTGYSNSGTVAFLAAAGEEAGGAHSRLLVAQLPQRLFSRVRMRIEPNFLRQKDEHLFLGLEGSLLRIDIREES